VGKLILSLFFILIFSEVFAQIKYNLFVQIEKGVLKGKIKVISDRNQFVTFYTKHLNLKHRKDRDYINVLLRRGKPFVLEYSYTPKKDSPNFIGDKFIYLMEGWYPIPNRYAIYNFSASLPSGFVAVSEAEQIKKQKKENQTTFNFIFPYPVDKVHLIASTDFVVQSTKYKDISLETFFLKKDASFAPTYLKALESYIREYESLITSYPYKRFAVVENFFQTGYSMPTFTLIGDKLIKYPFIIKQSLRHELLHQWFGNYVYIDFDKGNWAEGLTTYLSDHYFYEKKSQGWKYRKNTLLKYEAFVSKEDEYPVFKFRYKTDNISEAIGYGKVMFIFHMLKNQIGEENFYRGLRTLIKKYPFKEVSWKDIEKVYEKITQKNLKWFFDQWVYSTKTPDIEVENISTLVEDGKFHLSFELKQKKDRTRSKIYFFINTVFKEYKHSTDIYEEKKNIDIYLEDEPLNINLDKNYDLFRVLKKEEKVPIIANILGSKELTIIVEKHNEKKYKTLIRMFSNKKTKVLSPQEVKPKDLKRDLIVLDKDNPFIKRFFASVSFDKEGLSVFTYENPFNYKKVSCLIHSSSKEEIDKSFYKLKHYGMYSYIYVKNGKTIKKGQLSSQRGQNYSVREITKGVPVKNTVDIKEVIDDVSDTKIIYVGEQHTNFSHHIVQLNVIKGVYKSYKKVSIGMEMFQRKFQPILDRYINGEITEKEFLKKTEYFKRWGYDYNLYKPILDFAKKHKIPVIALNIETEILKKVSKEGLESLTLEEREKIPTQMDFSNTKYRNILKKIFGMHKTDKNFEHFFQSQILWDETMAETIDSFLKKNPKYKMVVLVGNGHIKYGFGIPSRCYRRNKFSYKIILNDEKLDKEIGDFVLYPQELEGKKLLKLGVYIKETEKGLKVIDIVKNSLAQKLGIKKGDIILEVNGSRIKTLHDLKVELFFVKTGEQLKIKVLRGKKEITLKTKI